MISMCMFCIIQLLHTRLYNYTENENLRVTGVSRYGRLEFSWANNLWGVVCDSGFDTNAAKVACRQLGYDNGNYNNRYYNFYT